MAVLTRMKQLIDRLNDATEAYDQGKPYISDTEWDSMYFQLKALEEESGIIYPNSPTQTIEYRVMNNLTKATHNHKMLSLDKTKSVDEVREYMGNQIIQTKNLITVSKI